MNKDRPRRHGMTLRRFDEKFPTEASAIAHVEHLRWNGKPECPSCGNDSKIYRMAGANPYRCGSCRKLFNVKMGTLMEGSKLAVRVWLSAIWHMTEQRKGIAAAELARKLGVTEKTAWFIGHRIRESFEERVAEQMSGEVEVDEAFFGGRNRNRREGCKKRQGGGAVGKAKVMGFVERDTGRVRAQVMATLNPSIAVSEVRRNVAPGSAVYTDGAPAFRRLRDEYTHSAVKHGVGVFINGQAHTNGVESFWARLKRSYIGVHHKMSPKHLPRYVNDAAFHHSHCRTDGEQTLDLIAARLVGKRLRYAELTDGPSGF